MSKAKLGNKYFLKGMEGKSLTLNYVIKQAQGQGTWWDGSQLYYWKKSREMDLRLQMESSLDLCSKGNL